MSIHNWLPKTSVLTSHAFPFRSQPTLLSQSQPFCNMQLKSCLHPDWRALAFLNKHYDLVKSLTLGTTCPERITLALAPSHQAIQGLNLPVSIKLLTSPHENKVAILHKSQENMIRFWNLPVQNHGSIKNERSELVNIIWRLWVHFSPGKQRCLLYSLHRLEVQVK